MRAFMSTGSHDERIPHGKLAVREVERILRETEPMPDGYSFAERCYRGPLWPGPLPDDADTALAEALAAFVAE